MTRAFLHQLFYLRNSFKESAGNDAGQGIDPYHAAAILDLKRGWTGINNVLKINYAFKRSRAHCLCPSSLVSNQKWRLRDKGLFNEIFVPFIHLSNRIMWSGYKLETSHMAYVKESGHFSPTVFCN